MQVYVVMGNDYPEAVFDSEEKAQAFIKKKEAQDAALDRRDGRVGAGFGPRIYWRSYEFPLNG